MTLDILDIIKRPVIDDATVLIATLGRDILKQCLHSIATGTTWPADLVIVDQGSNTKVANWVHTLMSIGIHVEHVRMPRAGVAAGRNRGMEMLRTPFVVETDDDCLVNPDWLKCMTNRLRANPEAITTGRVEPGGEGVVVSVVTSLQSATYTRFPLSGSPLFPNNMGFAKIIYDSVGRWDESDYLRFAEDNDWAYRALRAGVPIVYAPEVVIQHLDWRSESELRTTFRGYARCQGGFYGKHLRNLDMYLALVAAIDFTRGVRRWIKGIIRSDFAMTASGKSYTTQLIPGILAGLRGKR
jgi:GT2 family glycosyltransferase